MGSVDMHSIHFYTTLSQEKVKEVQGLEYENNVFGPAVSVLKGLYLTSGRGQEYSAV